LYIRQFVISVPNGLILSGLHLPSVSSTSDTATGGTKDKAIVLSFVETVVAATKLTRSQFE
jgi:hypothetical protein